MPGMLPGIYFCCLFHKTAKSRIFSRISLYLFFKKG